MGNEPLYNDINDDSIFLPETQSSIKDEQKWKDNFKGPPFFHMEKLIFAEWQLAILERKILE